MYFVWDAASGQSRLCSGSAPDFQAPCAKPRPFPTCFVCVCVCKVSPFTATCFVGVRKTALLLGENSFHVILNRQEICEKEEVLGKRVVDTASDAAAICSNTPGCTRFAYFTVSATAQFTTNSAFFCSGLSRGINAAGWIAGATSDAFSAEPYADNVFDDKWPVVL